MDKYLISLQIGKCKKKKDVYCLYMNPFNNLLHFWTC